MGKVRFKVIYGKPGNLVFSKSTSDKKKPSFCTKISPFMLLNISNDEKHDNKSQNKRTDVCTLVRLEVSSPFVATVVLLISSKFM